MISKKNILGVGITNAAKEEILEYIIKSLKNSNKKYFIVTPNTEFLVHASKNPKFKNILNNAELALTDGIGVILAGKILHKPLKERITGVDLLESLCKAVAEKPITVGFLGGRRDVAEKTAECLVEKYHGLKVAFAGSEWPRAISQNESKFDDGRWKMEDSNLKMEDRRSINPLTSTSKNLPSTFHHPPSKSIDILFVAFGTPKQEIWISENLDKIPVKIAIGVGGAFDYISGRVGRASKWIRDLGFEWMYRLVREPWRIKRQLALLEFIYLVLREKSAPSSKK